MTSPKARDKASPLIVSPGKSPPFKTWFKNSRSELCGDGFGLGGREVIILSRLSKREPPPRADLEAGCISPPQPPRL